jgi:hypothetical protein
MLRRASDLDGSFGTIYASNRFLLGKLEGKRPLARHRHRWEDNIKISYRESGWGDVDWIHLSLDRDQRRVLGKTLMDSWVP